MADPGVTAVRFVKGDTVFHVHGDNAGAEGVWLAKGQVAGIYDSPVKTTYKTGAFQVGSTAKARKFLHRDLNLGFHIIDTSNLYELNESRFRQIFDYQEDFWDTDPQPTTIEIETMLSGVRKLDVLMYEQPEFEADLDPTMQTQQYGNLILKLRAAQPHWYEDDAVSEFTDTATSGSGFVMVSNPCDVDTGMFQKFVLTRGTWTIPDYEWTGPKGQRVPGGSNAERTLSGIVVSEVNGGCTVDWDRGQLMWRDANDSNIAGQMAGKFVNYQIPPYTSEYPLTVSYTDAPAGGAMARLVMPRRWSRPWGMELEADVVKSATARYSTPGTYSFTIPDWCDMLDIILLGGGGGGDGGKFEFQDTTNGGASGDWVTATLTRGTDIPWDSLTITGVIGAGGDGGAAIFWGGDNSGGNGSATTATAVDMTTLSAAGGAGGGNDSDNGEGAGTQTFNTKTYRGGSEMTPQFWGGVINGATPGGGGVAGQWLQSGGSGAGGAVWIRAYESAVGS